MSNKINVDYLNSPYGEIILGSFQGNLCICDWKNRKSRKSIDVRISKGLDAELMLNKSAVIDAAKTQLMEFFAGERKAFDIKFQLIGTKFQKSVWQKLQEIPYGETWSYLKLARALGNEKAIRAIASANGANALSLIIPCHRIIGSDQKMIGYAGGIETKRKLLELEGAIKQTQLSLFPI